MAKTLIAQPLTRNAFEPYGDVIEKAGSASFLINEGRCMRHHALATTEVSGEGAQTIISIFAGTPYKLPHRVGLVERHPLGSQAFFPLGDRSWLVIACSDDDGVPRDPRAFLAGPDQGVNLKRGVWHGVLTPLEAASDFLVVDRGGPGDNLEEYRLESDEVFFVDVQA